MDDANARQHKNVMEQVNNAMAEKSASPKPLSPQEALACKQSAADLDAKKKQLDELNSGLFIWILGIQNLKSISKKNGLSQSFQKTIN